MAHAINKMIHVGEMPWHGLGVRLPARASYEEIVHAAGFYEAVEKDVYVPPFRAPIPDKKALVRGDSGEYLAVVGKGYEVVQFSEVARTLVEAAGDVKAVFTTAGTLGPVGIKGWLLGELPDPIKVKGDPSPIRKYVLGTTGHDGITAVVIKNVATRVVCANTLGVALGERGKVVQLFETAIGIERVRGTAWAAFQGWTEYADHHRLVRDTGREDPRRARLASIWMGRAAGLKQAALSAITEEAGIQMLAA